MNPFKKFVDNRYINLLVGFILIFSGLLEAWGTLYQDIMTGNFATRHGVIIFGFFYVLKQLSEIFEGIEHITKNN